MFCAMHVVVLTLVDIQCLISFDTWNLQDVLINIKLFVSFPCPLAFKHEAMFKTWQVDYWAWKKLQITQIGLK